MELLRSWPAQIPDGRAYVMDAFPRLVMDHHHYGPLRDVEDDVLLLEWDIAVGQEDLHAFAGRARENPDEILVAPYRIYADTYNLPADIWAHRSWDGVGAGTTVPHGARPIGDGQPFANLFGLGMIYLPWWIVRAWFLSCPDAQFGDVPFSMWHYSHIAKVVPVDWDVHPVHLNYQTPEV